MAQSEATMDSAQIKEQLASAGARAVSHRSLRSGSIGLVLLIALILVGAALFLIFIGRDNAQPYILALLAALSVIGIFALFSIAAGILRFANEDTTHHLTRPVVDGSLVGMAITDASGRVLYANPAYLTLTGATSLDDVRGVERVFTGDPDLAESVYRLAQATREGRRHQEDVRFDAPGGVRWFKLRVRPLDAGSADKKTLSAAAVWTVEDTTRDRARTETAFEDLQKTIDFLDHAPAGFFSAQPNGDINHLNATLAEWLGYDLTEVGTGG